MPHGIEPAVKEVLPDESIARFRTAIFGEPPIVTLIVAANKHFDRKAFQVNLRAWAAFAKEEPGALLYIHTDPTAQALGVDLRSLPAALGIAERVHFPDRYSYYLGFPAEYMDLLYDAADTLLAASMSEGFGIPIIEAQGCGTPVVVTDLASMPELVRGGVDVPPANLFWASGLESWLAWPDWRGVRDALGSVGWEKATKSKREDVGAQMRGEYGWEAVVQHHWLQTLERVA